MAWKIELSGLAQKNLRALDRQIAIRIFRFLNERLAASDDPRSLGEALKGSQLGSLWKYRVGDYRIIAMIEDRAVRILVVRIGNRRDVYRR
ncbi:MAG TPA: type II toxin-antitoxin system RelE/ParE family toxin [Caulobacteraceae bacterium]